MGRFRRNQDRRRLEVISRIIPLQNGRRVLDAGTGAGWLAEMLSRRGFEVTALDLGGDSLVRAARRARERRVEADFVQGDIYRLPFRDGHFDTVTACEILEHLDYPEKALREIARVVRPGGYAVISTPYRERIEMTRCIHCNRNTPVNAHLHSFDKYTLGNLLRNAGFSTGRTLTYISRPGERLGLAGLSASFPYAAWRIFDALLCRLLGRQSFLAIKAVRDA